MALALAHFHGNRNGGGKAKGVRKARHRKKPSDPVRRPAALGGGGGHAALGRTASASRPVKLSLLNSSLLQSVREQLCRRGKNPGKLLKRSHC